MWGRSAMIMIENNNNIWLEHVNKKLKIRRHQFPTVTIDAPIYKPLNYMCEHVWHEVTVVPT